MTFVAQLISPITKIGLSIREGGFESLMNLLQSTFIDQGSMSITMLQKHCPKTLVACRQRGRGWIGYITILNDIGYEGDLKDAMARIDE